MEYLVVFVVGALVGGVAGAVASRQVLLERVRSFQREIEAMHEERQERDEAHAEIVRTLKQEASERIRSMKENAEQLLRDRQQQWRERNDELTRGKDREIAVVKESEAKLRSEAAAAFKNERVALIRQLQDYRDDEERLKNAFAQLSVKSLDSNSSRFLGQAEERLKPLVEHQKKLEAEIRALESKRQSAYDLLTAQTQTLSNEAHQLNRLLASPPLRGSWGEFHLKKVVELAGLKEHIDFQRQVSGDGIRPDMVVDLPGKREIVVDSKVPLTAFSNAVNAQTDVERDALVREHVKAVPSRIAELSRKEYQSQFERLDFVIIFIPVEAAYYTALEADPELVDFKTKNRVLLAGPVTLIALLRAVAFSWREVSMVQNASRIGELAETLHQRLKVFNDHFAKLGTALTRSIKTYNDAVASFGSRLLPQVRSLESYIRTEGDRLLSAPGEVEEQVRALGSDFSDAAIEDAAALQTDADSQSS